MAWGVWAVRAGRVGTFGPDCACLVLFAHVLTVLPVGGCVREALASLY